ncbi:MAG: glycosyltransferase family A protein, partial [Candidatus Bathyarchaeia archaeon]
MTVSQEILKDPKISVIIPAYNARKFIAEAIESVLDQTFPAHEIIVVDDGSTDGTGEFVRKHYGSRVEVIQQENKGISAARNIGVVEATGNILQFLDADDLLLSNKFEVQLNFWQRNPEFDIVYCDHLYFRDGEVPTTIPPARPLPQGNLLEVLVDHNVFAIHSALVPRQVAVAVGGFNENLP